LDFLYVRLTPPEIGRAMHAKLPGSQFVLIPTAGRLSNIEQPEAFNRAVLDFL
jgi:3-oxoadipate enol-lactonase